MYIRDHDRNVYRRNVYRVRHQTMSFFLPYDFDLEDGAVGELSSLPSGSETSRPV